MNYKLLIIGFSLIVHVKCQLDVHIDELLYEEDEEDDEAGGTTRSPASTSRRTTRVPRTAIPANAINNNNTNASTTSLNSSMPFVLKPSNDSIFSGVVTSIFANTGVTTERVHYVLNQVGGIFNNVGTLNITGIVDQALGIRNSQFARPLVTGILNAVLCNPVTYSENNCRRTG